MSPIIFIIPGAWHVKAVVDPLVAKLQALDQRVQVVQLESVGGSATIGEDGDAISKVIGTLADRGEEILLVPHSYAGAASAPAQKEFAKVYRKEQGRPGGIIGLVYIAGFLPPEGLSMEQVLGGKLPAWQLVNEDTNSITVEEPLKIFYGDLPVETAKMYASLLKHQSLHAFRSAIGYPGYQEAAYDGKRAYVHTENDGAIPPNAQRMMREHSGVGWEVKSIATSHPPFLSKPDEAAEFLVQKAKQYSS